MDIIQPQYGTVHMYGTHVGHTFYILEGLQEQLLFVSMLVINGTVICHLLFALYMYMEVLEGTFHDSCMVAFLNLHFKEDIQSSHNK